MGESGMYVRYGASLVASLGIMYFLAYSQIDGMSHFTWSLSILWISLSMISSMALIMLVAMWKMLPDRKVNVGIAVGFAVLLVGAVGASRTEALVGDDAFLGSMIPHHSRAIHMCQEAALEDPEILQLCEAIIDTQREEIAQMKDIQQRRG